MQSYYDWLFFIVFIMLHTHSCIYTRSYIYARSARQPPIYTRGVPPYSLRSLESD